ncbi:hypothetical protein [Microbacterium sp. cf046]|uniref:hypothetical protein n=1 Tax=Microbacterium sp. cf046 TaxID=1761803 RepID=UPI000B80972D|nr:hypothetical protein [Microbacterium sp. cf046]
MSRRRTRASDLQTPFHGIRLPAGDISLVSACRARLASLTDRAVISHVTAARLHDLPLPPALARTRVVHISVPAGIRAPGGRRTSGHQTALAAEDFDSRHGIACTTPERTFCDMAPLLSLGQLVAIGDHLIRNCGVTRPSLAAAVEVRRNSRGRNRLRRALQLLDEGAESPKESELRVIIVEAGLPAPLCNRNALGADRRFIARIDLSYPDLKIAIEYEGDHHRGKSQWRADIARRRRLEAEGWIYLSVTQADLVAPSAFLRDLRTAIDRRLAEIGR